MKKIGKSKVRRKEILAGYLFLIPAALCLLVWTIIPIISSFVYSLTDYDILNAPTFIGIDNPRLFTAMP